MENPLQLSGKTILITGSASGIGGAIISKLINLDAKVVLLDKDLTQCEAIAAQYQEGSVKFHYLDIEDNPSIEPAIKEMGNLFGPFHGFVFAAGIGGVKPLAFTKYPFLHNMMNANVFAFVEMVRCVTKKNMFHPGGSIVALSSVSSVKGLKSKTAYSASKAALDASVRALAAELGEKKIRINSIRKGWVSADMQLDFIKDNMNLDQDDDLKNQFLGVIEPDEIANTVAFLLSDATRSITGTSLLIDGGYTL